MEPTTLGRAAAWFPLIGLGIGLVVTGGERATGAVFPPLLDALLTVTLWKLLTGGLHLDGLADCLDGLMGKDAAQRLRIMRDSRIGAFGAIGLILFLLLEVAAVSELAPAPAGAPWSWRPPWPGPPRRWSPGSSRRRRHSARGRCSRRPVPCACGGGRGAGRHHRGGRPRGRRDPGLRLACPRPVWGSGWFATRRLGGITGDVLGAAIEAAELIVLLTLVAWSVGPR